MTNRWTDDETVWSFVFYERHSLLLLQTKHDDGEYEHQRLTRASERYTDDISS